MTLIDESRIEQLTDRAVLVRIQTPYACAGVVIVNGRVVRAADIFRWMHGRTWSWLRVYLSNKRRSDGWRMEFSID